LPNHVGTEDARVSTVYVVRIDFVIAGVLRGAGSKGVFLVFPEVATHVVPEGDTILRTHVPIHLTQMGVDVLGRLIRLQISRERCQGYSWSRGAGNDHKASLVTLGVVTEKEKQFVLSDWTSERAAELIEVIRTLAESARVVDERVRVHALVAVKLED